MEMLKNQTEKKNFINEDERRARLDKKNERARAKRRTETEEEKRKRLEKRNEKDRARRREESTQDKKIRLGKRKLISSKESPQKRVLFCCCFFLQFKQLQRVVLKSLYSVCII